MVYAWKTRERVSLTIRKTSHNRDYTIYNIYNNRIYVKFAENYCAHKVSHTCSPNYCHYVSIVTFIFEMMCFLLTFSVCQTMYMYITGMS